MNPPVIGKGGGLSAPAGGQIFRVQKPLGVTNPIDKCKKGGETEFTTGQLPGGMPFIPGGGRIQGLLAL